MKRIIVGIKDPSRAAELVTWTAYLADSLHARPTVVHAVQRSEMWMVAGMQLDCTQYVREFRRRFVHHVVGPLAVRGIDAELRIVIGEPARVLADFTQRSDVGLILIGASTHARVREVLAGSVGQRLEHMVNVPLVVVPASALAA